MIHCTRCGQRLRRGMCKICNTFEGRCLEAALNIVILEIQALAEGAYRRALQGQCECETEHLREAIKA